jgi:hypothetical protein
VRRLSRLVAATLPLIVLGVFAGGAGAEEVATTFPGAPLTVSVGPLGQCQSGYSSYENGGGNFFSPADALGDCGFFLAFPKAGAGQPVELQGTTWGFNGSAGPGLGFAEDGKEYLPVSQSAVTGAGTTASPYTQTTIFEVTTPERRANHETGFVLITETTTYVDGEPQFTSTYNVKNLTQGKLYFRAIYAGDLYVTGSDYGTGVYLAGPPPFIGGQNAAAGVLGGFTQAALPSPPWSAWEEGCWNETPEGRCEGASPEDAGIWHDVRSTVEAEHAFNDSIDPALIDNAAGVEWDQLRTTGLAKEAEQAFTIINRTGIPSGLQISPVNQTLTQGQTETINVTALNTANEPYAGKSVRYTVAGANPQSGAVTLNSSGQAQVSYVGNNAGLDTIQLYVDLGGSGSQTPNDPAATAQVTFVPKPPPPPTPNSTYTVQSIKANANGTITITFVPTQSGQAVLTVTVPTGTIARYQASIARHRHTKKCTRGLVLIKHKCQPKTTVTGSVAAPGTAGAPLTLTVKPSSKLLSQLQKGKTIHVVATLTYTSSLGGAPTVHIYPVTLKGKKPKKHHHGKH